MQCSILEALPLISIVLRELLGTSVGVGTGFSRISERYISFQCCDKESEIEYFQNEKFEDPADNHDTEGQFDPRVHSFTGKVGVTLPGLLHPPVDSATLQAGMQLGGEFKFNLDMNSGTPLGLGMPVDIVTSCLD